MNRINSKIKFVGLHAHSVAGSIFDAIGYPQDHMDFAYENGCDALALTDHGNMNGLAYQVLHAKKMQESGKDFKQSILLSSSSNFQCNTSASTHWAAPEGVPIWVANIDVNICPSTDTWCYIIDMEIHVLIDTCLEAEWTDDARIIMFLTGLNEFFT